MSFVRFRRPQGQANRPRYAWHAARWANRTNAEIARDLGMPDTEGARSYVAEQRRRLAPETTGRFVGFHAQRRNRP